ncbi:MAG: hypothetical protein K6E40_01950 [Desulfovibrio sp.]|nr:hypothetical protein [Desulfovibrio sp.]
MAYVDGKTIVTDLAFMVPDASLFDFGVAVSAMHMAWMRAVCGRLKSDYRYSRDLCWNTFPWPNATAEQQARIRELADGVLAARDEHPDMCLADMYNPESMPEDLLEAHHALDLAVDALYRPGKPFSSDEDRLQVLFKLYEGLVKAKEGRLHA